MVSFTENRRIAYRVSPIRRHHTERYRVPELSSRVHLSCCTGPRSEDRKLSCDGWGRKLLGLFPLQVIFLLDSHWCEKRTETTKKDTLIWKSNNDSRKPFLLSNSILTILGKQEVPMNQKILRGAKQYIFIKLTEKYEIFMASLRRRF